MSSAAHPKAIQLVQYAIADLMTLGEEEARARGVQAVGGLKSDIPAFRAAARLSQALPLLTDPDGTIAADLAHRSRVRSDTIVDNRRVVSLAVRATHETADELIRSGADEVRIETEEGAVLYEVKRVGGQVAWRTATMASSAFIPLDHFMGEPRAD